jgi:ribosomal protein S27E
MVNYVEQFRYRVLFNGKIRQGDSPDTVQNTLASIFGFDAFILRQLFSGHTVELQNNLNQREAHLFKSVFDQSGAVCTVQKYDGTSPARLKASRRLNLALPTCTKCNSRQITYIKNRTGGSSGYLECRKCGAVLSKKNETGTKKHISADRKPGVSHVDTGKRSPALSFLVIFLFFLAVSGLVGKYFLSGKQIEFSEQEHQTITKLKHIGATIALATSEEIGINNFFQTREELFEFMPYFSQHFAEISGSPDKQKMMTDQLWKEAMMSNNRRPGASENRQKYVPESAEGIEPVPEDEIFRDAWNQEMQYVGSTAFFIRSAGEDGLFYTHDDIKLASDNVAGTVTDGTGTVLEYWVWRGGTPRGYGLSRLAPGESVSLNFLAMPKDPKTGKNVVFNDQANDFISSMAGTTGPGLETRRITWEEQPRAEGWYSLLHQAGLTATVVNIEQMDLLNQSMELVITVHLTLDENFHLPEIDMTKYSDLPDIPVLSFHGTIASKPSPLDTRPRSVLFLELPLDRQGKSVRFFGKLLADDSGYGPAM